MLKGAGIAHGQNSLTGNSYPDRSVESKSRYGDPSGSSHEAALETGAVATAVRHHETSKRDNNAPETDRSFPLGGSSTSGYGSSTADTHSSNLANKVDPRIDRDGSRTTGNTGYGSNTGDYRSGAGAPPSSDNSGSLGHDPGAGA